jgi:hypothetical protein
MTAVVKYPANEILPHGWSMLTNGNDPNVWLDAYDGSIRFYLMGGFAIADYYDSPECVQVHRDGLKGLIPPWKHITQKGATQDGITQLDALIDPNEVELKLRCLGRDGRHVQRVARHVYASIDAKQQSRLNFLTLDEGHWWSDLRWYQGAPPDPVIGGQRKFQDIALRLLGDRGFWRSYDDIASFEFVYNSVVDEFDTDYSAAHNLGPNWPQLYTGPGAGYCSTSNQDPHLHREVARWYESGGLPREVVNGPYKNFSTDTDNQVIEVQLGVIPELTWPRDAYIDIWGRKGRNPDGSWDGNGIRARIGRDPDGLFGALFGWVQLTRFNSFAPSVMTSKRRLFRPHTFERFRLVCGTAEDDPRMFRVLRNGIPILSHKEVGTGSRLGAAFRGAGFGMAVADGPFGHHQASPAWVRQFSAADNILVTQSGFLARNNLGDQPMYDDYTVFGPINKVRIWNGPNAGPNDFVEFGPLAANQVAMLRTDPRDRNVYDLTTVSAVPTQQDKEIFDKSLNGFLSFLTKAHIIGGLSVVQSLFGVFGGRRGPATPQGNLYQFLTGRFSDASAIPAKSPGNPAQTYYVKIEIDGATADTKVLAAGTPLRRYPL